MVIQNSTIEFYDAIYRKKANKWASIDRDYVAFKILSTRVTEPKAILDYGCGNGHALALFKSQWAQTLYYGVDISTVALRLASARLPSGRFTSRVLPKKYNVITIMGVAEHFENPAEQLREIAGYLAEDGLIYLEVPHCLSYSPDKTEGFRKTHMGADQDEWHLTRESWEKIIHEAGLSIDLRFAGADPTWEFIWLLKGEQDAKKD